MQLTVALKTWTPSAKLKLMIFFLVDFVFSTFPSLETPNWTKILFANLSISNGYGNIFQGIFFMVRIVFPFELADKLQHQLETAMALIVRFIWICVQIDFSRASQGVSTHLIVSLTFMDRERQLFAPGHTYDIWITVDNATPYTSFFLAGLCRQYF